MVNVFVGDTLVGYFELSLLWGFGGYIFCLRFIVFVLMSFCLAGVNCGVV